jgi:hypothetical protein
MCFFPFSNPKLHFISFGDGRRPSFVYINPRAVQIWKRPNNRAEEYRHLKLKRLALFPFSLFTHPAKSFPEKQTELCVYLSPPSKSNVPKIKQSFF